MQEPSVMDFRRSSSSSSRSRTGETNSSAAVSSVASTTSTLAANYNKNWTGEEYIPVINKISGKRLSGNKAPQLKRLFQW